MPVTHAISRTVRASVTAYDLFNHFDIVSPSRCCWAATPWVILQRLTSSLEPLHPLKNSHLSNSVITKDISQTLHNITSGRALPSIRKIRSRVVISLLPPSGTLRRKMTTPDNFMHNHFKLRAKSERNSLLIDWFPRHAT